MSRASGNGKRAQPEAVVTLRAEICANLNRFFDESGATKADLARAVNVTPAAVKKWLTGESSIDPDNIKPVCDFLGVPIHALLGEESSYTEVSAEGRRVLGLLESLDARGRAKFIEYGEDLVATGKHVPVA